MPDSAAPRLVAGAHQWARLALVLLVIGPSILLVYAWVEVLNNPGLSLADGFLTGREPTTSIGIVVSLCGALAGLLAGSTAIAIEGGWWRRFLVVPSVAAAVLWWGTAGGFLPYPGFDGPDAVGFAFRLPVVAALLVLLPAALLATLCLSPRMVSAPRTRMRRLQSAEPMARTPFEADDDLDLDEPDDRPG